MADTYDDREEELSTLAAIYPELERYDDYSASIDLAVSPTLGNGEGLFVGFHKPENHPCDEHQISLPIDGLQKKYQYLKYLPDLKLNICLPDGYPAEKPPIVGLESDYVPARILLELQERVNQLWDEFGQCQILFTYIDALTQAAEEGFGLNEDNKPYELPPSYERSLVDFNNTKAQAVFDAGAYDCGICLERKKGTDCYFNVDCEHVFCKPCLQDYYTNAITEGDVDVIRCLNPTCGEEPEGQQEERRPRKKPPRSLHPRKLLQIGISEPIARRYVELKRQKKLDVDPHTVYCPRKVCQKPARNGKYPPIPANLDDYRSEDEEGALLNLTASLLPTHYSPDTDVDERLAVCENPKCKMAFCRICYKSWHGSFERCQPRDPGELSAEEKASYEYIAQNTSPCAYCRSPVQKTYGCNHMACYQCKTHFCYLCSAWLSPENPYAHFNRAGDPCFNRLFDLVEGEDGRGEDDEDLDEDGEAFVAGPRHWEAVAMQVALEAGEA